MIKSKTYFQHTTPHQEARQKSSLSLDKVMSARPRENPHNGKGS
jgi:hypothetical protein